jgi:hypothetical protein
MELKTELYELRTRLIMEMYSLTFKEILSINKRINAIKQEVRV